MGKMEKIIQREKYQLVLMDIMDNNKLFQVIVPSRVALGELLLKLKSYYFIVRIEVLNDVKEFRSFFNDLYKNITTDTLERGVVPPDVTYPINPEDLKYNDTDEEAL